MIIRPISPWVVKQRKSSLADRNKGTSPAFLILSIDGLGTIMIWWVITCQAQEALSTNRSIDHKWIERPKLSILLRSWGIKFSMTRKRCFEVSRNRESNKCWRLVRIKWSKFVTINIRAISLSISSYWDTVIICILFISKNI